MSYHGSTGYRCTDRVRLAIREHLRHCHYIVWSAGQAQRWGLSLRLWAAHLHIKPTRARPDSPSAYCQGEAFIVISCYASHTGWPIYLRSHLFVKHESVCRLCSFGTIKLLSWGRVGEWLRHANIMGMWLNLCEVWCGSNTGTDVTVCLILCLL